MNEDQEQNESRLEEAKNVALDIEEGMKSIYWGYIKKKIEGWLAVEKKHLDLLNSSLIRNPEDVEERNDTVKRVALLGQFLRINEIILDENLKIVDSMRKPEFEKSKRPQSFVNSK